MANSLYLPVIEQHFLGLLLCEPSVWPDVSFITREEFSDAFQHLFDVTKQQLDANQSVTPIIVAEKLKSFGQSGAQIGGVDTLIYLEGLQRRGKGIEKTDALALAKELKKATVKRQLIAACKKAATDVEKAQSFDEMTEVVTKAITSVETNYFKGGDTVDLFAGMEAKIELEGNSPLEKPKGFMGPFPSFNETFGPIIYPGSMALVGARSGIGKSSLSWFYTSHVCEKNDIPLLILDAAEMTEEEIQYRAVCAFSEGVIPYGVMDNQSWRKSAEYTKIIREQIWPRVRKMAKTGIYYKNIGGMTGSEIIAHVRRFYFNKVGRDRHLLINLDYIKGMDTFNMGRNTSEFQSIGNYVMDFKTLITQEITASIWTSVQNNRDGVVKSKPGEFVEEHDGQLGLSDRIIQQCTHGFIMRFKTTAELGTEKGNFGNIKLAVIKKRRLSGPRAQDLIRPVKTASGFRHNYFNLDTKGFAYRDLGTYGEMCKMLGHVSVDLSTQQADEQLP
jgi:replicative DNA helicase